jgi:DNA-binding XRE family transcriptional regulator
MSMKAKKQEADFQATLRKHAKLDETTGDIKFDGLYASCYINVCWKRGIISLPHAHIVWFLKHGRWPVEGMIIDHKNDDPMDNRPDNLQELTHTENQKKRRGRVVYRSYGKGKYGYGITVYHDKRDDRFYVNRQLSRGHGKGDLKNVKRLLSGHDTLKEAEKFVRGLIIEIQIHGADYMPDPTKNEKRRSIELMAETQSIRRLRSAGYTLQQIADETGFALTTIYNKTKDVDEKAYARGHKNGSSVYSPKQVLNFKQLRVNGISVPKAAKLAGIRKQTAYQIDKGFRWKHIELGSD